MTNRLRNAEGDRTYHNTLGEGDDCPPFETQLHHVITNVLECEQHHHLYKYIADAIGEGASLPQFQLADFTFDEVNTRARRPNLEYSLTDENDTVVCRGRILLQQYRLLRPLQAYIQELQFRVGHDIIVWVGQPHLTLDELQRYMVGRYRASEPILNWAELMEGSRARAERDAREGLAELKDAVTALTAAQTTPRPHNALADFERGNRRTISDYPEFRFDKEWDQWSRSVKALASTQGVGEPIQNHYTLPTNPDELELHHRKSDFLYTVWVQKVRTNKGMLFVKEHTTDKDGHAVWEKLRDHYTRSQMARSRIDALRELIVTDRIPSQPRRRLSDYLTDFDKQVTEYNDLVPRAQAIEGSVYTTYMRAFVSGSQLAEIDGTFQTLVQTAGIHWGPDEIQQRYRDHLESRAQQLDALYARTRRGGRAANLTESLREELYGDDNPHNPDTYDDDDDAPDLQFQANSHRLSYRSQTDGSLYDDVTSDDDPDVEFKLYKAQTLGGKKWKIDWDIWRQLSQNAKRTWVTIDDKDRELILNYGFLLGTSQSKAIAQKAAPKKTAGKKPIPAKKTTPGKPAKSAMKKSTSKQPVRGINWSEQEASIIASLGEQQEGTSYEHDTALALIHQLAEIAEKHTIRR